MKTTEIEKSVCPECGESNSGVTDLIGSATPRPGDYSVCAYCSTLTRFDQRMQRRRVTVAELMGLDAKLRQRIIDSQRGTRIARERKE